MDVLKRLDSPSCEGLYGQDGAAEPLRSAIRPSQPTQSLLYVFQFNYGFESGHFTISPRSIHDRMNSTSSAGVSCVLNSVSSSM